jgi:putative aminopeptidase FrvX
MRFPASPRRVRALLVVASAAIAPALSAQTPAPATSAAIASWIAPDAPPGDERPLTDAVLAADPRWHRDALGNLVLQTGSGSPHRLVACGLDHSGFAVSEIADDGYLRLHRIGTARTHTLWDQFHEAQQIRVLTSNGSVPGVVAVTNAHFARQHRADTLATDVDHLWVDVGATSRADVARLGITLLDPVVRDVPAWSYADQVAGADASGRTACAAVASAARGTPAAGTTVFVLSTQRSFGWTGLAAAAARLGHFDAITLVAPAQLGRTGASAVATLHAATPPALAVHVGMDSVTELAVRARFPGSLVESVDATDADALLAAVARAADVATPPRWLPLAATAPRLVQPKRDSLSATADLLARLAVIPGVPNHEWRVRDTVLAALPAWARRIARVDAAGNVVVAFGPDRDTTVVVAHMDEVAYTVASVARDGMVTLTMQGGLTPSAWEDVPALLHFDPAPGARTAPASLRGVFVPRDSATLRRPSVMRAWFGMDSAALASHGIHPGLGVTAYKHAERLASTRFASRALDDRAGSTALLLAIARLDPARSVHKVIFAWSTAEEIGLDGARALARAIGTSVRHVYAVDTFVSSDTPLESPHFAFIPLGSGAVLRGLDDGTVVVPAERERIETIAHGDRIPLQVGATQGATDAVPFIAAGATGIGLSWPGRYSHSPAEVLDLRDLNALVRLVDALATVR